ncbi:MAG: alpha-L-rhamnosidase [Ruminococcaceae bacterium]|nr:alpha-L-rhamnosidase [Oscillospiraceae bacterium]
MFQSKWIAPETVQENMHLTFLGQFCPGAHETAVIRITADDYYKLYINGIYVGAGPAPSYPFRYRWNEYDISPYLQKGVNIIEAQVYYQGLNNRVWVSGDERVGMIADILIDGAYRFGTDKTWQYRIDNTFTGGDRLGYDTAYTENRDFTAPQNAMRFAKEADADYTFDDAPFPAIETEIITPQFNGTVYDFTREYIGTPIIRAYANRDGARLTVRCAEELCDDGSLRYDMRCGCKYEETCILKSGENLVEQYDYKALRYLEIIADEGVTVSEVTLAARHYPIPETTQKIVTENEDLRAVFHLCKDTLLYGTQEVFIDCPTREKGQYLGDAYISAFAHYYLTKDRRMLKKALTDFSDSIRFSGRFLSVAPCSYEQKIADYDLLYPDFLLTYYELTGDRETLRALTPTCAHILGEYNKFENADGLLENVTGAWNLIDWPENMRDGYEEGALGSVINAYYIFAMKRTETIRTILNQPYIPKADKLKTVFHQTFLDKKTGLYLDCAGSTHASLHANILPVAFGISESKAPAEYLLKRGMQCSVYLAYFFLKALCEAGFGDAALGFITADTEHSWRHMLGENATATFEAWGKEQKWNTSLFHPWATAPVRILNEYFSHLLK